MMSLPSLVSFFAIITAVIVGDVLCIGIQPSSNFTWGQVRNNNVPSPGPQWNSNLQSTTPWPALGQRRNQQPNPAQNSKPNSQPMWVRPDNGRNWVRNTPTPSRSSANTNFLNNERGGMPNAANQRPNSNMPRPIQSAGTGVQSVNQNGPSQSPNSNKPSQNQGGVNGVQFISQNVPNQRPNSNMPGPIQSAGTGVQSVNQNGPSQSPNSNKPSPSSVVTSGQQVGGGGGKKDNTYSNMGGVVSTGSMNSKTETTNQNGNEATDNTKKTGEVEDYELREFSEELLSKDSNNVARFVTVNLQSMTTSRSTNDEAPLPLLSIDNSAYSVPSIEKLMLLYNNYIVEANQNEVYTAQEKIEENNLLDTILSTPVMQHTRNFLIKKGKLGKDPKEFKDLLRAIWFGMYSRGQGRIGSSGFEHVFLAELKNSQVSGLHNWVYFNEEEKNKRANYLGYMRKIDLGNKGSILKYHFTFRGVDKPVGSMFIGTSPELEIALYSTCFVLRADKICPLKMGGNKFIIRTYTYRYRGKNMIGSAFPEI